MLLELIHVLIYLIPIGTFLLSFINFIGIRSSLLIIQEFILISYLHTKFDSNPLKDSSVKEVKALKRINSLSHLGILVGINDLKFSAL